MPVTVEHVGGPVPYVDKHFPVRRLKHFPVRYGAASRPPIRKPVPLWFVNFCDSQMVAKASSQNRSSVPRVKGCRGYFYISGGEGGVGETFRDVYEIYQELTSLKKTHDWLQECSFRERKKHIQECEEFKNLLNSEVEANKALRINLEEKTRTIHELRSSLTDYYCQTSQWSADSGQMGAQFTNFFYNIEYLHDNAKELTSNTPVFENRTAFDLTSPLANTYTETYENVGNKDFEANLKFIAFPDLHGAQFHTLVDLIQADYFFANCIEAMENIEINHRLTQRKFNKQPFHGSWSTFAKHESINGGILLATPAAAHLANKWLDIVTREGHALSNNMILVEAGEPSNGGESMFDRLEKIILQWYYVKKWDRKETCWMRPCENCKLCSSGYPCQSGIPYKTFSTHQNSSYWVAKFDMKLNQLSLERGVFDSVSNLQFNDRYQIFLDPVNFIKWYPGQPLETASTYTMPTGQVSPGGRMGKNAVRKSTWFFKRLIININNAKFVSDNIDPPPPPPVPPSADNKIEMEKRGRYFVPKEVVSTSAGGLSPPVPPSADTPKLRWRNEVLYFVPHTVVSTSAGATEGQIDEQSVDSRNEVCCNRCGKFVSVCQMVTFVNHEEERVEVCGACHNLYHRDSNIVKGGDCRQS